MRDRLWKQAADYFPQRLVKTADLPADRNYLIGYHPHGVISLGAGAAFGTDGLDAHVLFPGIKFTLMALPVLFILSFPFLLPRTFFAAIASASAFPLSPQVR